MEKTRLVLVLKKKVTEESYFNLIQTLDLLNLEEVKEKSDVKRKQGAKHAEKTKSAIAKINTPANIKKSTVAKKRNRVNIKNNTTHNKNKK